MHSALINPRGERLAARTAFAIFIFSASGGVTLANVALSGRVLDEAGRLLPAATVTAHKTTGERFDEYSQTDSQGRYSFSELPAGEYSVEAALTGFVSVLYKPLSIYFPTQVRWNFVLSVAAFGGDAVYASSELVGELRWKGSPAPRANICLIGAAAPRRTVCTTTNRLGQYFLDVPPGLHTVTVDGDGGLKGRQPLDMSAAGEYRNQIALPDR
jgi:hypothetical protein